MFPYHVPRDTLDQLIDIVVMVCGRILFTTVVGAASSLSNIDTLMCPEEDGWVGAAGTVVTRDCGIGYRGTRTRRCSIQGVWSPADESNCEEIRCPGFDVWEEAGVKEVQVHPCEGGGFAILTCGLDGEWEGNPTMCCTSLLVRLL